MKKPLQVLASIMLAGTLFPASVYPVFAETDLPEESQEDTYEPLPPLETGEGFTNYRDANGTIYAHAVWFVTTSGIAHGFSYDYFGVNEPIKRVDAAMILGNFVYVEDTDVPKAAFTDLPQRAVKTISILKHHGILNGKSKTKFGPNLNITRGEAAIMLHNAHKEVFPPTEELDGKLVFKDVSGRYKEAVHVLSEAGIIKGKTAGRFGTDEPLTRGQMALLIERIYEYDGPLGAEDKQEYPAEEKGLSISADKQSYDTYSDKVIKIIMGNTGQQNYLHRPEYSLQKQVGDKWYEVPYSKFVDFYTIMEELEAGEKLELTLEVDSPRYQAPLQDGFYRIVQEFYPEKQPGSVSIAAKFSIWE
ncbi:S-layer homology domain-containing protein [Planococcus sp. NCCP-2050]|uniref:S-layer homology domain-containing protein n=1 Tax=Planococcus sp. NCCP-2050 TaxID=2944679 RepID=UPI0020408A4C|nr:S-layer homology domain-containing protein [Planococcus sp. NCCP-2050]GKW46781.1 hypothetical protein NCCP2050_24730 [Planococcus sp. NCCP-2050]